MRVQTITRSTQGEESRGIFTVDELREVISVKVLTGQDSLSRKRRIRQISTDSRSIRPGDLFVALRGDRFDGHEFVPTDGNTTLTGLSYGSHSIIVYANDTAGNTGTSETITFSVIEPFPTTWIVAAIAVIAIGAVAFLVYFRRIRKTTGKAEQVKKGTKNTS